MKTITNEKQLKEILEERYSNVEIKN